MELVAGLDHEGVVRQVGAGILGIDAARDADRIVGRSLPHAAREGAAGEGYVGIRLHVHAAVDGPGRNFELGYVRFAIIIIAPIDADISVADDVAGQLRCDTRPRSLGHRVHRGPALDGQDSPADLGGSVVVQGIGALPVHRHRAARHVDRSTAVVADRVEKAAVQLPAIQIQRAPFGDLHHAHAVVATLRLAPDGAARDRQRGGRTLDADQSF